MKRMIADMLTCITTSDFALTIAELIADDVEKRLCQRNYTMSDVRLAIGRVLIKKLMKESKFKNIEKIAVACNDFDYSTIVKTFESSNLSENARGYGHFQDHIVIVPNLSMAKEITKGIEPIAKGKYWLVFDTDDMTNVILGELDDEDLYLLDYITKGMFEKEGIF